MVFHPARNVLNSKKVEEDLTYNELLSSEENLAQSCEEAIAQINDRMYGEEFRDDYSKILCYGVSFYKKRCLVRLKI